MKPKSFIVSSLSALILLFVSVGYSQFPEDALRLSVPGIGVGARSLSMGMAYTGIATDFSAAYWNPAGLGQMQMNEISLGLSSVSYGNTSSFLGNQESFTNSGTSLNSIGLVYPFPTSQGSLVFALGYGRQADFTTGLSFSGFNPNSSIIQAFAPDGGPTDQIPGGNLAYELYLSNVDSLSPTSFRWDSKILDSVAQFGKVLEGGGQNYVSVSGAVETAKNLFIGATLDFITGSYSYTRNYSESDNHNLYTLIPFDFNSMSLHETVQSDLSGFTMKLGLVYKFAPNSRFGFAVKTPSWMTVRETYSQSGSSTFDNGDQFSYTTADNVNNEYDVHTPFVFSAGISHSIQDWLLAADVEYTDYTQMEFSNASQRLLNFNTDIKSIFRPTANIHLGGEYAFPNSGVRARAGFAFLPSPYSSDPYFSSFAQKYVTAGLGFIVENAVAIDFGYAYGFWNSSVQNYSYTDASGNYVQSITTEKLHTNNLIANVSYRF